jgi:phage terminase large subunit-like protein
MTLFWNMMQCSLVEWEQCFGGTRCFHIQRMKAVFVSETSANLFIQDNTTHIQERNTAPLSRNFVMKLQTLGCKQRLVSWFVLHFYCGAA